jgi:hypothetical protein
MAQNHGHSAWKRKENWQYLKGKSYIWTSDELWRIRRNDKLEAIIKGENIVKFIKCQRIRWLGHIERMQHTAIPKKMYGKLYATRLRGRPKMR